MTQVSSDDVRRLAQLSSLGLTDDQIEPLRQNISDILTAISELDELDTEGVEPTYQVTGLENVWRTDEVVQSQVAREQLLGLAAECKDNQIKVPKVL